MGQIAQVERKRNRVKSIFLIGGFGESAYLQDELAKSMGLRNIQLRRPDTSWTAVVRGAVVYGIEKSVHQDRTIAEICPRSYGVMLNRAFAGFKHNRQDRYTDPATNRVMAQGQMTWLIKKDDLILSNAPKEAEQEFSFKFKEADNRVFNFSIYEYSDDDIPDRFEVAQDELNEVTQLRCDFTKFHIDDFDRHEDTRDRSPFYKAQCILKFSLLGSTLTITIKWEDHVICTQQIEDGQPVPRPYSGRPVQSNDNPFRRRPAGGSR